MAHNLIDIDLEQQVADLRKELSALRRAVSRGGSSLYEDASDTLSSYFSEIGERIGPSLTGLRRQARSAERMAYDHPAVVAGVGLVLLGLVASLLISRRRTAPPPRGKTRQRAAGSQASARRGRAEQSRSAAQRSH
jgi:hypothetical protein